ncbi:MAG TPA: PIN domain-containing protein [Usitatibacter sp.]|nr:PIN domain-containing protein [Usitatibacter sp.]
MIAVDTNVLLRRVLDDDANQSERARRIFESEVEVLITDIVLAEAIWSLKGARYKATPNDVIALIMGLLEERNVVFESRQAVWSALNDFIKAVRRKTSGEIGAPDLADALVVNKAKVTAALRNTEYRGTYTFDKAALLLDGTRAP